MTAKSLVVGGNGFIGKHLTAMLVEIGHDVSVFDRFSSGKEDLPTGARPYVGDFLDRNDLAMAVQGQDYVFHFLSTTTPATAAADPTIDIRVNIAQSVELFDACSRADVRKLFFASSGGSIYGMGNSDSIPETAATRPISPYAIGKLTIENYLEYFRVSRGLEYTIFRISNPYGPGQARNKGQGLIPITLGRISKGMPAQQFGDGSMVRDYVFLPDLMEMLKSSVCKEGSHRIYNLGSGTGHSVSEILSVIREVVGQDFAIEELSSPSTYLDRVVLDISRFRADFGFIEPTTLERGISSTWDYINGHGV